MASTCLRPCVCVRERVGLPQRPFFVFEKKQRSFSSRMLAEFRITIKTNETRLFTSCFLYWIKFDGSKDRFKRVWTDHTVCIACLKRTAPTPLTQTHAQRTKSNKAKQNKKTPPRRHLSCDQPCDHTKYSSNFQ